MPKRHRRHDSFVRSREREKHICASGHGFTSSHKPACQHPSFLANCRLPGHARLSPQCNYIHRTLLLRCMVSPLPTRPTSLLYPSPHQCAATGAGGRLRSFTTTPSPSRPSSWRRAEDATMCQRGGGREGTLRRDADAPLPSPPHRARNDPISRYYQ